jgi:hypothetical protein
MRALRLTSMALATAFVVGTAEAADEKPEMEVLIVTAARPAALEAPRIAANDAMTLSIDFGSLRIEPPRIEDVKTRLDEITIDAPPIELVLTDEDRSKS